jgi:hypothetical protein
MTGKQFKAISKLSGKELVAMAKKAEVGVVDPAAEREAAASDSRIEDVSISTRERIADGATLLHRLMTVKEGFAAYVKRCGELQKEYTTLTRKACGYALSGRQQMLFPDAGSATLRMEGDVVELLEQALADALHQFDPEVDAKEGA